MTRWGVVGIGCGLAWALVCTGRVPEAGVEWRIAFVVLHLGSFVGLLVWLRTSHPNARLVIVGAVLFRLIALPMLPTLSDDGYRYLWDGRVTVESDASPYEYRPSDPALAAWQSSDEYRRMNSTDYYSVYPPASQAGFALAVALGGGDEWRTAWWAWKLILVLCELGAIWVLLRRIDPGEVALYAWSPLAVIEVAGQGHTEALVVAGLAGALLATRTRWPIASIGLTLAGGVKLYPLVWLPHAWRREGLGGVVSTLLVTMLLTIPFWHATAIAHIAESLGLFFGQFDEYAAPYLVVKSILYPMIGDGSGAIASRVLGVAFLAAVAWGLLSDDGTSSVWPRLLSVGVLVFTLATSTLHPWYWLPALFLVSFVPARGAVLWLITWASAGYLGYVLPGASLGSTLIGWSGAAVLAAHYLFSKSRRGGQAVTASAVTEPASTHSASG